jgi:glutamate N-acetyltransferase/amino-acid N-acetyltransferase
MAKRASPDTSTSTAMAVSPLAPKSFPKMGTVRGVEISTSATGEKYKGRKDLLVMTFAPGSTAAGVFTQSATRSAAVEGCQNALVKGKGQARVLVVNAGNANAFTGRSGKTAVKEIVGAVAALKGCRNSQVFTASTGVIGEPLNTGKIIQKIAGRPRDANSKTWQQAAEAIRTTDTFSKGSFRTAMIGDTKVSIGGIAKGSGMIAPDMATLLSFVFTDAKLPANVLQAILTVGVRDSFNSITVDSDTSTSDTMLFFATGQSDPHAAITRAGDPRLREFRDQLQEVLLDLAHQVVRDGEGATKFITVRVTGAKSVKSAKTVAQSIANSPLVKTAIAGEDANWGRVVMAVGKAGEPADRDRLAIQFGPHMVAERGQRCEAYSEKTLSDYMRQDEIDITVDLKIGTGEATLWTCDLTHGYISINADYRS